MSTKSAEDWNEKGKKQLEKGNFDIAIIAFEKAIEEDELFVEAWHNKGIAYKRHGKLKAANKIFDKALELCEDILKKDADNADAWYWQGKAFFEQDEYEAAIDCFKQALKINSRFEEARFALGHAAYMLGENKKRALELLIKATEKMALGKK